MPSFCYLIIMDDTTLKESIATPSQHIETDSIGGILNIGESSFRKETSLSKRLKGLDPLRWPMLLDQIVCNRRW